MAIPQQHETDFSNPRERFLWAFRGMEFRGNPVAFPQPVLEEWSEHLSRCGFVHVSEVESVEGLPRQEIHYQPPVRGQDHVLNTSGKWVPVEQEIVQPSVPAASFMTDQEKAKMIREFREEGLID